MKYDVLLFDLDDTLFDFSQTKSISLEQLHKKFYPRFAYSEFFEVFNDINSKLWQRVGAKTNALMPEAIATLRFEMLHQKFKVVEHDINHVAATYELSLGENAIWFPGAMDTIQLLHQQGYLLGVITNGLSSAKRHKYQAHQLHRWFDAYIVSDEVGVAKPDKTIFDKALHALVANKNMAFDKINSVLMIGDSLAADGVGAKNAGIDFCWVTPGNTQMKPMGVPVHYQVKSVIELPEKITS